MDTSSPCSDPNPLGSSSQWSNLLGTYSDEEMILASERPKRRAGRKKFNETRHPVYSGVRQRNSNRWVCELREPNKKSRIWLGTYPTAEMAARAHDVAALALRGQQACLNFADSVWRLPVPVTNDAKGIRAAAAEAAEAFRPREGGEVSGGAQREESGKNSDEVSSSNETAEVVQSLQENVVYMDEEAMFDMPGLIASMAEGLLLSPPSCLGNGFGWDDSDNAAEVSLWSYSI
ncbi:hypothetical protein RJ639_042331 [Escallonia herrerae]|uniref:AP2/ERF domain-containing protein n=1 Tax=Escallonia herrerae TaxID=1293975 RepID=A0AA88WI72_9ASTE|nr:hypothetical protein RJ639_042331 [Escallonia herrerae]